MSGMRLNTKMNWRRLMMSWGNTSGERSKEAGKFGPVGGLVALVFVCTADHVCSAMALQGPLNGSAKAQGSLA